MDIHVSSLSQVLRPKVSSVAVLSALPSFHVLHSIGVRWCGTEGKRESLTTGQPGEDKHREKKQQKIIRTQRPSGVETRGKALPSSISQNALRLREGLGRDAGLHQVVRIGSSQAIKMARHRQPRA